MISTEEPIYDESGVFLIHPSSLPDKVAIEGCNSRNTLLRASTFRILPNSEWQKYKKIIKEYERIEYNNTNGIYNKLKLMFKKFWR